MPKSPMWKKIIGTLLCFMALVFLSWDLWQKDKQSLPQGMLATFADWVETVDGDVVWHSQVQDTISQGQGKIKDLAPMIDEEIQLTEAFKNWVPLKNKVDITLALTLLGSSLLFFLGLPFTGRGNLLLITLLLLWQGIKTYQSIQLGNWVAWIEIVAYAGKAIALLIMGFILLISLTIYFFDQRSKRRHDYQPESIQNGHLGSNHELLDDRSTIS